MADTEGNSRRQLVTKLLPFIAVSAIKLGMLTSPLGVITSAANTYNQTVKDQDEKVGDLLPLLPGIEKLHVEVTGPDSVVVTLEKQDVEGCAEQYLRRLFTSGGAAGARAGVPSTSVAESIFDYVLRLPSKNVYLKMEEDLSEAEATRLLGAAKSLNPAEVLVVADKGVRMEERLDPVFVSENKVMRGRVWTMSRIGLLSAFFGDRFAVALESSGSEAVRVSLRLVRRPEP